MYYNYNQIYTSYCDIMELGCISVDITIQLKLYYVQRNIRTSTSSTTVFLWSSYLQEGFFSKETKLMAVSDADLFLDTYNEIARLS